MAGLFKNKIIKEKIEQYVIPDFDRKLSLIQSWSQAHEKGELQKKNETQCEQAFNQDFFIEVLGYSAFPKDEYTIQPKDNVEMGGGQMPDATLGHFSSGFKRVIAVVEIKDANTSLDKSQRREGSLSPVQQAFKYKPQYKECGFVIATNFFEIRLFRDNQLDYERFTLTELVDPKNDYFNFRKFYYLLNVDNFIADKGETVTEKLLSAIRIKQEEITSKFYSEYKKLREDLINDIVKNNEEIKRSDFYSHIVDKAQKIVDRIVFICFFEDSGLLPENKLLEVVDFADKHGLSAWTVMKDFFTAVDAGSAKLGIPDGYNGELFKQDNELNNLIISDAVCKRFVDLTKFDFSEDLSVNILGHIFEQSITDLERLKSYSEGGDNEVSKKDTKRKKDGIFYTPEYVVDYIVKNSLGKYLEEREQELFIKHKVDSNRVKKDETHEKRVLQLYSEYQDILQRVKVLDPACGSGAFLVKVFDYLLAENIRVANIVAEIQGTRSLLTTEDYIKKLLQNNIYGVDLNPESVEITKLSLWFKSAQKGQKLVTLKDNIKCGNSLIDDALVAGERAFDWHKEFPDIMENGGFDVVVGNPPYTYRNSISETEKEYFRTKFHSTEGNFDLYKFFIEHIKNILKNNGYASFIVPNTFLSALSYKNLRKILMGDLSLMEIYDLGLGVFADVVVESVIFLVKKNAEHDVTNIKIQRDRNKDFYDTEQEYALNLKKYYDSDGTFNIYITGQTSAIVEKMKLGSVPLKKICYSTVGVNTGYIKSEIVSNEKKNEKWHKLLSGKNIGRYDFEWAGEYIMYDAEYVKSRGKLGRSLPPERIFQEEKVLMQRTRRGLKRKLIAYYDTSKFYTLNRLSNIVLEDKSYSLKYVCAVLNSALMDFYFNKYFNEYEVKPKHLDMLPMRSVDADTQEYLSHQVDSIQILRVELNKKIKHSTELLRHELGLEKVNKKIEHFYELTFDELVGLSKNVSSLEKRDELLRFFTEQKEGIVDILSKVKEIDNAIDSRIFDIYGLSQVEKDEVLKFES